MLTKRLSLSLFAVVVVIVAVTAVTGAPSRLAGPRSDAPNLQAPTQVAATLTNQCGYQAAIPADRFKGIPAFNATQAAQPFDVRFVTTQGVITVRMLTAEAPCTTFSFRFLASHGYYNITHCHRLTIQSIYVLQCGDPTGTGSGGPGYSFNDENLAGATYTAGTVAMANSGADTNGSQFFLVYRNSTLSPNYTPFGKVVKGLGIIQNVAKAGSDNANGTGDGHPKEKVVIESVTIKKT